MQSSLSQDIPSKVALPATTNAREESSTNSEIVKKKRKRNRKKSNKVENLISKTFQAKIEAENLSNKTNNIIDNSDQISNMSSSSSSEKKREKKGNKNAVTSKQPISPAKKSVAITADIKPTPTKTVVAKSREEILAEREAKKLSKQLAKGKGKPKQESTISDVSKSAASIKVKAVPIAPIKPPPPEISSVEMAEKDAKDLAKTFLEMNKFAAHMDKSKKSVKKESSEKDDVELLAIKLNDARIAESIEKKIVSKSERRAIQEAQRAAKAKLLADKQKKSGAGIAASAPGKRKAAELDADEAMKTDKSLTKIEEVSPESNVKLFNHLHSNFKEKSLFVNHSQIHPAMIKLGEQFANRVVVGSNSRCIAFLNALKIVIQDYENPPKKEFLRSLEASIKCSVDHLQQCRPLAVSVINAHKCIKFVLTQLPTDQPESEIKEHLCEFIETYIKDQIEKAALAISNTVQEKITDGDVILTFGCSSLINHIIEEAHARGIDFRVVIVDSRPFTEGQELLRRLVAKSISCTYVLVNAVGFIMPEATKVLVGAHALLANGYVMSRTGTAQVALVAKAYNVPFLVCCETHKFSERVQTDAIVYNELGNPDDMVIKKDCKLANWRKMSPKMSPLNLNYDITPPALVTAVVTEVAILPCTSVPVILRLKPTEMGY